MLAGEVMQSSTLRGAIAEFLAAKLRVQPDHLRLEFDPRDDEVLDVALDEHRFEIEPVSSVRSNRVDQAVRIWSEGQARDRITVRVSPTMYLPVVMMKRDVSRGSIVTEQDIELIHQWLQPVHGGLVMSEGEAVGRIATVRLSAGDALREQHVRRETLVRRGDLVIVRALVGGSVLTMPADARANGSEADTIEFRKVGERDTFLATVTGRNEAIIDLQR
jgi:flagellar basal body P-ring formation protein FlgA